MNIASSITETKIIGREKLFKTSRIIMNIATIEIASTTLKSWSVISIISLVQGASPMSIPFLSYFLSILLSLVICSFTSSEAVAYSEFITISFQLSLCKVDFASSGIISSGILLPTTDSSPNTNLTPSIFSISLDISRIVLPSVSADISTICVEPTWNSSSSLVFAIEHSMVLGSVSVML